MAYCNGKRTPLSEGTTVKSGNTEYIVDGLFSDAGGSCLVYSAHYDDGLLHSVNVLLKECYPLSQSGAPTAIRCGNSLCWMIGEYIKEECLEKFREACDNLFACYHSSSLSENTVYQQDCFECNNTVYNAVTLNSAGKSYDKYSDETIADILATTRKIAAVIGVYHKKGFLHLDIKPQNFLVATDAGGGRRILLFDLDSIAPMEDGHLDENFEMTYSPAYCAPEQLLFGAYGEDSRYCVCDIGPWTDIYAIGAILLEKICGALPRDLLSEENLCELFECEEYTHSRAWRDGKGNEINPAVKYRVTEILGRCLAQPIGERFCNTDDLICALDEAAKLCKAPYIVSNIGSSIADFVGRENEISRMKKIFSENSGTVILQGEGGIGKTTIAHEYYRQNRAGYHTGVYLDYANGRDLSAEKNNTDALLSSLSLMNFDIKPDDADYSRKCAQKRRELLNEKGVLIILDNFDAPADDDDDTQESYRRILRDFQNDFADADIIITTRSDINEISGGLSQNTAVIHTDAPDLVQAAELFEKASGRSADDAEAFRALYDEAGGNTLVLNILAKLLKKEMCSLSDILAKYRAGYLGGRKINIKYSRTTAGTALENVWNLAALDEKYSDVLCILWLFRRTDFNDAMAEKIYPDEEARDEFYDKLDRLAEWGWVTKSDSSYVRFDGRDLVTESGASYFLHSLIKWLVKNKFAPDTDKERFGWLKKYEFYMYFVFEKSKYGGVCMTSKFEKDDKKLESLTLPAEFPPACGGRDFECLTEAQRDGYLGNKIEVDPENPFYKSKYNSVLRRVDYYHKIDSGPKELVFMSIEDSKIPDDEDIRVIGDGACAYNRNEIINIPRSVRRIGGYAFEFCKAKKITVPSRVDTLISLVFHGASRDTEIEFEAVPRRMPIGLFFNSKAKIVFKDPTVKWIGDCLVNTATGEFIAGKFSRHLDEVRLPEGIKQIKIREIPIVGKLKNLILPKSIQRLKVDRIGLSSHCPRKITYNGTKAEWEAIEKDDGWNFGNAITLVKCSDGDINL